MERTRSRVVNGDAETIFGSELLEGWTIPSDAANRADRTEDIARLERAVALLIGRHRDLVMRHADALGRLEENERRIHALEGQVLDLSQRRLDVGKRIDDLLAQVDQLDAELVARGG